MFVEVGGRDVQKEELFVLAVMFLVVACSNKGNHSESETQVQTSPEMVEETAETNQESVAETPSGKILIAYFTLADNYERPSDMDATSQASINIENKELVGNTEYLANAIHEETGGDLFSVVVKNPYPNDYDKITDMGSEEQEENARPELSSHVENMEQYQTVYLGDNYYLCNSIIDLKHIFCD